VINNPIYNASIIIDKTGQQIDAMFEKISAYIDKAANKQFTFTESDSAHKYWTKTRWMCTGKLLNYYFLETPKPKRDIWLCLYAAIYNEEENESLLDWEPSLYVFIEINGSSETWGIDKEFYAHSTKHPHNSDGTMWIWDKSTLGCAFTVPLTNIENERVLENDLLDPTYDLIQQLLISSSIQELKAPELAKMFTPKS